MTGAGVLEAKKALEQTDGNFDKAVDIPVSYTHLTLPTSDLV